MGTRSMIGMEQEDGTVLGIYCHWDGYWSNNGRILVENYTDRDKVAALIGLGALSSLKPEVAPADGVEHSYAAPAADVTIACHRDRGDDSWPAKAFDGKNHMHQEEYAYVFTKGGEWVGTHHNAGIWAPVSQWLEPDE